MVVIGTPQTYTQAQIQALIDAAVILAIQHNPPPSNALGNAGVAIINLTYDTINPAFKNLDGSDGIAIPVNSGQLLNLYYNTVPNNTNYINFGKNWNPANSLLVVKRDIYNQLPDHLDYFEDLPDPTAVFLPTGDPHNFFTSAIVLPYKLSLPLVQSIPEGSAKFVNLTGQILTVSYTDRLGILAEATLYPNTTLYINGANITDVDGNFFRLFSYYGQRQFHLKVNTFRVGSSTDNELDVTIGDGSSLFYQQPINHLIDLVVVVANPVTRFVYLVNSSSSSFDIKRIGQHDEEPYTETLPASNNGIDSITYVPLGLLDVIQIKQTAFVQTIEIYSVQVINGLSVYNSIQWHGPQSLDIGFDEPFINSSSYYIKNASNL